MFYPNTVITNDAILPWTLQHLKGFEIPGIVKIDFLDTKAATDKVTKTVIKPGSNNQHECGCVNFGDKLVEQCERNSENADDDF